MLTVLCWKWKRADGSTLFGPEYVNRLRAGLERHLHLPHRVICMTDDPIGIDARIETRPITAYMHTPRCQRRMVQYDPDVAQSLGERILSLDLDVVIVDDLTPLVDRQEPLVMWKVNHAGVFCGSMVLYRFDALAGAWDAFRANPTRYPALASPRGIGSDQAMVNYYLRQTRRRIPFWTEADGIITYYGKGYERFEHLGVGPNRPELPQHARIVVLGSADKHVMDEGRFPWIRRHWSSLDAGVAA